MLIEYGIYVVVAILFFVIGSFSNKFLWKQAIISPIAEIIKKAIPSDLIEEEVGDFLIELGEAIKNHKGEKS